MYIFVLRETLYICSVCRRVCLGVGLILFRPSVHRSGKLIEPIFQAWEEPDYMADAPKKDIRKVGASLHELGGLVVMLHGLLRSIFEKPLLAPTRAL